jgi:hypothetical protein
MPQMARKAERFATLVADPRNANLDRQVSREEADRLLAEGKVVRTFVGEAWEPAFEFIRS